MLQSSVEYADVDLAEKKITRPIAEKLWQHLKDQNFNQERFYYRVEVGDRVRAFYVWLVQQNQC